MAGTTQPIGQGFIGWDEESSFAEDVTTYDKVAQIRDGSVNVSGITHPQVERMGVYGKSNQGELHVQGAYDAPSITFTQDLYGHGSTTAGALTETDLVRMLGHGFGISDVTTVGGALTTGTNDTNTLTSTNTTMVSGKIIRVGALGDTRANGQASVIKTVSGTVYELSVDLPGSPTTADSVKALQMIAPRQTTTYSHLTSSGADVNNTIRIIAATATQQYALYGCAMTGCSINVDVNALPTVETTWTAAAWDDIDVTFPTAVEANNYAPGVCCNGSLHIQTIGTTTRNSVQPRNVSIAFNHTMTPIRANGGVHPYQNIQGWVRGRSNATITFSVEAQDATSTPTWSAYWNTDPNSQNYKGIMYTASVVDGSSIVFWAPRCRPVGPRPTLVEIDGLHFVQMTFEALENDIGSGTGWGMSDSGYSRFPWALGLG